MSQFTSPKGLLRIFLRRSWIVLLILLIGIPCSLWFAVNQPRLFEATAVIQIEAPQIIDRQTGLATSSTANNQLELIEQKLMSRDSMISIISQFDLFGAEMLEVEKVAQLRQSISILEIVDPAQAYRPDVQPSGLLITVRLGDADQAAAVANEMLDSILAESARRSADRAARTLEFFLAEEERVNAEIVNLEAEFARFKQEHAASLPDNIVAQRQQLSRFTEAQIEIDQQTIEFEISADRLRDEERQRQASLFEQQRELIVANVARIETALARGPEVERQYNAIFRQLTQLQDQYVVITTRRTEAAMTHLIEAQDQASRFEVLERADVPAFSVSASRKKIAIAGLAATTILAITAALLAEAMSPAIRTAAQLERQLGVEPVIVIPELRSGRQRWARRMMWLVGVGGLAAVLFALFRGRWDQILSLVPGGLGSTTGMQ
ncbi:MAG: chain-length determining protein [Rhodobacteraceae bacterium]|nr:chain-length determining protein [Paracoccaceae bacterium]